MHRFKIVLLFAGAVVSMPAMAEALNNANSSSLPEPSIPAPATRGPEPLNDPGTWVTVQDYPAEAMRDGVDGIVGFSLSISSTGKVADCTIAIPSGSPVLDKTACELVRSRALFQPARQGGKPVAGRYSMRLRWGIARFRKPAAGELVVSFLVGPDGTQSDCRVETAVGEDTLSDLARRNPCLSGNFEGGYVDQAGHPVTRRVRTTVKTEILAVP